MNNLFEKLSMKTKQSKKNNKLHIFLGSILAVVGILLICMFFMDVPIFQTKRWVNPVISCENTTEKPAVQLYPIKYNVNMSTDSSPMKMSEFCKKISSKFEDSNLSYNQGQNLISILISQNYLNNIRYNFSQNPDISKNLKKLTIAEIKDNIAVKQFDSNSYEIFYDTYNCGSIYEYDKVTIVKEKITKIERYESWRAEAVCMTN
jgi:hypothetical protein